VELDPLSLDPPPANVEMLPSAEQPLKPLPATMEMMPTEADSRSARAMRRSSSSTHT